MAFTEAEAKTTGKNIYDDPERARLYDRSVLIRRDGILRAETMEVEPSWTVLDIGAGPGTLALPLSRRVKSVTAVEPSAAMRDLLNGHIREQGLRNIRVFPQVWEEVDLEGLAPHDLVIASYSLLMEDWDAAFAAMDRAALQRVDVYWFDGQTSWDRLYGDLYPEILGREYVPGKKVDHLLPIAEALGRTPEVVHLTGTSFPKQYAHRDEALKDLRLRLGLKDGAFDGLLSRYIEDNFIILDGAVLWPDTTVYTRVSWKTAAL